MKIEQNNEVGAVSRVCCFCERWESGGIESFLFNTLVRLDLTQIQVDIVATSFGESVFTKPLQERGIHFFELSGSQRKLIENYIKFRALMRERRWDVLYLNAFQGLSLYYLHLAKEVGVPVRIAHSHNTALRESITKPVKRLLHGLAKRAYANDATDLWACSTAAAGFLFPKTVLDKRGFQFIPNGIDIERFRFNPKVREQVRVELGLGGKFVVGNVGRLCYQKNQAFLLDIFAQVEYQRPDSCLLLVGDGRLLGKLKRKAQKFGIADRIIFYGISSHIERLLWAMDVFAQPSRFEGLPITSIEAQASGLPVVASEVIPDEACISPTFHRLTLEAGAKRWADALLGAPAEADRISFANRLEQLGFDISSVAKQIETRLLNDK